MSGGEPAEPLSENSVITKLRVLASKSGPSPLPNVHPTHGTGVLRLWSLIFSILPSVLYHTGLSIPRLKRLSA